MIHRRETHWEEYIFILDFFFLGSFSGKIIYLFVLSLQASVATYGEN